MKSPPVRLALAACLVFVVAGCSSTAGTSTHQSTRISAKADAALSELRGRVLSKGPHGESPAVASALTLTVDEEAQVRAKNATAAIVMHTGGDDWSQAQIAGLKYQFEKLGIKVVAVTDAAFKPDKQVSDIETVLSLKPSIIVSLPTDAVATANAYKEAAKTGAKLVFMDNVPQGMTVGEDYVSVVSSDNRGNGVVSAHLMAKAIGGKGKIGVIFHQADFFVTKQRYDGFLSTIQTDYPDVNVVEQKGIAGPDFAGDAQAAANAMLTKYPDLSAVWAVWDVPAEGVMAAARSAGRSDLVLVTEDLGKNVAISLAKGDLVKGLGAQRPFDQGVAEATLGAYGLIGKQAPPYVALDSLAVTHDNVREAWTQVYHQPPPDWLNSSYKK
ncbi:substrate-binding domain-containing protein [Streptomyces sp. NPDC058289]|uniref:substrate-binding domain-containing protein n=1 Tax=Streptomyces sp. NPDC058289 TaxID=3346425 RepID=UPI0036F1656D